MPIRHIVLLRFKPTASAADISTCMAAFTRLPEQIEGIINFTSGINESPEGLNKGFTHVAVINFEDALARDAYLPHPAHQSFVAGLKAILEDVLVFDYAL